MSNPVRFVTGVSYTSVRSPIRLREVDRIKDFSVCARCVGATTAPEGDTYKDVRVFPICSDAEEFIVPDSLITFARDSAIKVQFIKMDYDLSGFVGGLAADGLFYGFMALVEVNYRDESGRTVLLTHVFDMSHTNEEFEVRDIPGFKAVAGSEMYVSVKLYSLNPAVGANIACVGNLTVSGSYSIVAS